MRRIYHLVPRATWESAPDGPYYTTSLDREGFIHCANAGQVARAANRFYQAEAELLVLVLDVGRLTSPLQDDEAGDGDTYPHIYGALNRDAVVQVRALQRDPAGRWLFAE